MYIKNLNLKNIGPFKEAELNFEPITEDRKLPVIIITGENGTGKSIIIDTIRALFLGSSNSKIERHIHASKDFKMYLNLNYLDKKNLKIESTEINQYNSYPTNDYEFNQIFSNNKSSYKGNFIINYWSSKLSNDDFTISNIKAPDTTTTFNGALTGIHKNVEVTESITFFDYLKDSEEKSENKIGKAISSLIKKIINISINNGELKFISRTKLQPVISVYNKEVTLDKLSSGNLYLIQRLIYILKQAYANCINFDIPIENINLTPGILLIDEAENHLHPKWQKTFLKSILDIFPNLQLIVTTHSPFIVSSIENSRVYVCSNNVDHASIKEETDLYSNKPVEEILLSTLFNTSNFSKNISDLIESRKKALKEKDLKELKIIENKLLEINPEYFNYLNIENLLKSIKK